MTSDAAGAAASGVAITTFVEFDDLYREHYSRLTRALAIGGAGNAAEDLAQEAMARTLARWRRVRKGHESGRLRVHDRVPIVTATSTARVARGDHE